MARAGAYAIAGLAVGLLTAALSLALGLTLLGSEPGPGIGSGTIAAVSAGSVIGAMLCAIMGVAAGALIRNQVVGVVGALILMFVVMPLLNIVSESVLAYTPLGASVVLAGDPTLGSLSAGRGHAGRRHLDVLPSWSPRSSPSDGVISLDRLRGTIHRRTPAARPAIDRLRCHARAARHLR